MKLHKLKTVQPHFSNVKYYNNQVENFYKKFEIRKNDRNYQVGDLLLLLEYDIESKDYTGDGYFTEINYILNDSQYTQEGFVILGLNPIVVYKNEDLLNNNIDYKPFLELNENESLELLLEIMESKNLGCFEKWIQYNYNLNKKKLEKILNQLININD